MKMIFTIAFLLLNSCKGTVNKPNDQLSDLQSDDINYACPTKPLKDFSGSFKGVLSPIKFEGDNLDHQNLFESHTITSCTSFEFDVHYSDPSTGEETREVKFTATWHKSKKIFTIKGHVIQGEFRILKNNQYIASFETHFGSTSAHCEEMMTMTNNANQIVRSVQCSDLSNNGKSLGVRNALVSRVTGDSEGGN